MHTEFNGYGHEFHASTWNWFWFWPTNELAREPSADGVNSNRVGYIWPSPMAKPRFRHFGCTTCMYFGHFRNLPGIGVVKTVAIDKTVDGERRARPPLGQTVGDRRPESSRSGNSKYADDMLMARIRWTRPSEHFSPRFRDTSSGPPAFRSDKISLHPHGRPSLKIQRGGVAFFNYIDC